MHHSLAGVRSLGLSDFVLMEADKYPPVPFSQWLFPLIFESLSTERDQSPNKSTMPSVIPSSDVESLSEGRDTDVVMSKARMHLRILHAVSLVHFSIQLHANISVIGTWVPGRTKCSIRESWVPTTRISNSRKIPWKRCWQWVGSIPRDSWCQGIGGSSRSSNVPSEQTIHW